jgi:hypothetical protein
MNNAVWPNVRPAAEEFITKLIKGGYLQSALRNDPEAVTSEIVRLKEDLRGSADNRGLQAGAKTSPVPDHTTPKTKSQP